MSNTIDLNLSGDNTMKPLAFSWKAFFVDGSIIEQYENGIENKFQLVKDKFDQLVRFSLVNKDYSKCFTVDLKNGFILYNNYRDIKLTKVEYKENIRLIFFRRHTVEMTEQMIEKSHKIIYFLGLQWTVNNQNHSIILQIDENGDFIIGN